MYYGLSLYFQNGGGSCYILSVGNYSGTTPAVDDFKNALTELEKEDEPTLIVLLDATALKTIDYYALCDMALAQCKKLGDRFLLVDIPDGDKETFNNTIDKFRSTIGINNLSYAAAYYPYLNTTLNYVYEEEKVIINGLSQANLTNNSVTWSTDINGLTFSYVGAAGDVPKVTITAVVNSDFDTSVEGTLAIKIPSATAPKANDLVVAWNTWKNTQNNDPKGFEIKQNGTSNPNVTATAQPVSLTEIKAQSPSSLNNSNAQTLAGLKQSNTALYNQIKSSLADQRVTLPPSPAIAGVYASVDRDRGVWKAPANVSLNAVIGPVTKISDTDQDGLNVDPTAGKSINAIRSFTGKGTLVWGGRTLAGNDNEWRYVSVRRLFINIEESTRKATAFAVFEPNDATTWLKVKAMIESYLYGLWQQGAMAGSKPELAYFVSVGLGKTMTAQDILEGRMIVNIGVAAVRPAEFIILCFSHKMQEA